MPDLSSTVQQIAVASLPAILSLIAGWNVFYGEFRALSERVDYVADRSTQYHHNVREAINEHSGEAAHGTVREDLGKHDLRLTALEHRANKIDLFAQDERYTEADAKRDFEHIMVVVNEQRATIRDLRLRIRILEQDVKNADKVKFIPNAE